VAQVGVADPPAQSCSGDPVRIFEGLDGLLRLDARLTEGKTLRLGLLDLGVEGAEIDAVEAAVRPAIDLGLLTGSGAPLRVAIDRFGGVHALEIELAEGHLIQACRDGASLAVRTLQHPLRTDVAVLAFTVPDDGDLAAAVSAAREKPEILHALAETLAPDVDLAVETRPGDALQVIVEKRWLGRAFHRYGAVLAARYRGAAGHVAHYHYKPAGAPAAFFDGEGQPTRRRLLRSPLAWHPVDVEARATLAPTIEFVDGRVGALYARGEGAPVVALADAVVHAVRRLEGDGVTVELRLEDGSVLRYAHLMRTLGELEVGSSIAQGRVFALVGHTGKTPGDRLRLEIVEPDGDFVDPALLTATGEGRSPRVGPPIPDGQRPRFLDDVAPWRRAMRDAAR
jgi:murein DD-endopeptidase MepM/ murein hydrolase activator NlpD